MSDTTRGTATYTLLDLLRHLGQDAQDCVVAALTPGELAAARRCCHALRETVDSSISEVSIRVGPDDTSQWRFGAVPLLQRFPRCSKVSMRFAANGVDAATLGNMLALPFAGLSIEARHRITSLTFDLEFDVDNLPADMPGMALAAVLLRLPALRHLSLGSVPDDIFQQQLMYDALASLPHLEELELPHSMAALHVYVLAPRLRRLVLCMSTWDGADAQMMHSITRLRRLEYLRLGTPDRPLLLQLLYELPPSVKVLELWDFDVPEDYATSELRLCFTDGRITALESAGYVSLYMLADLVKALVRSGLMAQRLTHVLLDKVVLLEELDTEAEVLRSTLQQCGRFEMGTLVVTQRFPARVVLQTLQWTGLPKELCLHRKHFEGTRVRLGSAGLPPPLWAPAAAADPTEELPLLPAVGSSSVGGDAGPQPPPSLQSLALERVLASPDTVEEAAARTGFGEHARCSGTADGGAATSGTLVLCGPHVARLLALGPAVLCEWLERQSERARQAGVAGSGQGGNAAGAEEQYSFCLPLSRAASALMWCRSVAAATAVATAAAADAAAAQGKDAVGGVVHLRMWRLNEKGADYVAWRPFAEALQQVAQAVWDGDGFFATWSQRRRLGWLLEQWEHDTDEPHVLS